MQPWYSPIDRPRRLVFTWQTPPTTDTSRVTIEIAALDEGCEVTITHEMAPEWESFRDKAANAWLKMADAIATLVETR